MFSQITVTIVRLIHRVGIHHIELIFCFGKYSDFQIIFLDLNFIFV